MTTKPHIFLKGLMRLMLILLAVFALLFIFYKVDEWAIRLGLNLFVEKGDDGMLNGPMATIFLLGALRGIMNLIFWGAGVAIPIWIACSLHSLIMFLGRFPEK